MTCALIDPEGIVADLGELIASTNGTAEPAVRAYLYRTVALMALDELAVKKPTRTIKALTQTGRALQISLTGWDGDVAAVLPSLAAAVEAVAEALGVAADLAIKHATDANDANDDPRREDVADRAAGAYDALVGASRLLSGPEGVSV